MRFADKRVLVTGSSRNTGLGIAAAFAAEGARVVINGTRPDNVAAAVAQVPRSIPAVADLSTLAGVEALFAVVEAELGGLDVLVNNAVHLGVGPSFVDVPDEFLVEVTMVNVLGYLRCAQAAARRMAAGAAIVNLGSNTSENAVRHRVAYCTSKGAIDAMTRALALDLAPRGIRVNCVAPGYILTERWDHLDCATLDRRRGNVPLGQPSTAADVAAAVLYLASAEAGNVTGARLVVDGGVSVQMVPAALEG